MISRLYYVVLNYVDIDFNAIFIKVLVQMYINANSTAQLSILEVNIAHSIYVIYSSYELCVLIHSKSSHFSIMHVFF